MGCHFWEYGVFWWMWCRLERTFWWREMTCAGYEVEEVMPDACSMEEKCWKVSEERSYLLWYDCCCLYWPVQCYWCYLCLLLLKFLWWYYSGRLLFYSHWWWLYEVWPGRIHWWGQCSEVYIYDILSVLICDSVNYSMIDIYAILMTWENIVVVFYIGESLPSSYSYDCTNWTQYDDDDIYNSWCVLIQITIMMIWYIVLSTTTLLYYDTTIPAVWYATDIPDCCAFCYWYFCKLTTLMPTTIPLFWCYWRLHYGGATMKNYY